MVNKLRTNIGQTYKEHGNGWNLEKREQPKINR